MADVSEIPVSKLVMLTAEQLKSVPSIKPPEWAANVKSGSHAERVIEEPDFWFKRCGSLLVASSQASVGVRRLRHKYGGRNAHTVSRAHHRVAGGKLIRLGFQQLEAAGLVKKDKHGRSITAAGTSLLAKAASKAPKA